MAPGALGIGFPEGVAQHAHFLPLRLYPLAKFTLTMHDSGPDEAKAGISVAVKG